MQRAVVVGLGVVLLTAAGCGSVVSATSGVSLAAPWDKYARVEVRVRNGDIELRSGGVTEIKISGKKRAGGLTPTEAQQNVEQVTIFAGAEADRPDTFLVELRYPAELRDKSVGADLVVEVPEPCAARVETSNGSIRVARLAGEVELTTSNGDVRTRDVQGSLNAATSNGRIDAEDVTGDVSASSSNGDVVAKGIQGSCVLTTSNGDVRVAAAPPADGRIELASSNGSIHATLPEDLAAELKLKTGHGRVHVALGQATLKLIDSSRSRFHAVMNGGGGRVVAETSNGSITLDCR